VSKKQDCVSHSTPEAEIVAAAWALRREGIPALQLWDVLLQGKRGLYVHEDNQSMIRVCQTGRNPTMRHLNRTHGVCVSWLKQRFDEPDYHLFYEHTSRQAADIYTKAFDNADKWSLALSNINIVSPDSFDVVNMNFYANQWQPDTPNTVPTEVDDENSPLAAAIAPHAARDGGSTTPYYSSPAAKQQRQ